jgi:Rieske 2Fe-2S family protein
MPRTDAQPAVERDPAAPDRAPLGPALEPNLYLEPEIVRLEQEAIFERTWQLAGHVADLAEPGSYITADVVDQPVLVVRDHDGEIRAFRNVCRHRGSRLLAGSGSCGKAIRCLYHGWTYKLDGRLIGVPEGREIPDLDKSRLGLHQVRAEVFCGLIFVNLDPGAAPLGERLGGLAERLARYDLPGLKRFGKGGDVQPANWKVVVENYIEGYHIPIAHPSLMRLLDYQRYDVEVHDDWVWFEAPMRDKPSDNRLERVYQRLVKPAPGLGEEDRRVWRFVLIYPNTTIDLYPDQVNTWRLWPDGADVTRDEWGTFRHPDAPASSRVVQKINNVLNTTVLKEDVDLVDNVQRGIRTRGYHPGPLSRREAAVAWFADRIRADLGRAVG